MGNINKIDDQLCVNTHKNYHNDVSKIYDNKIMEYIYDKMREPIYNQITDKCCFSLMFNLRNNEKR